MNSILGEKLREEIEDPPENVTTKGEEENAVDPPTMTLMGAKEAPIGTVTISCEVDAEVTAPCTPPKKTTLFKGTALKLVPVIVTAAPMGPEEGVKDAMVGA